MPRKPSNKTLKKRAWNLFSQYIRGKYADSEGNCTCYTCGVTLPAIGHGMQCGHGIGGRGNYVLFLEEICRPQCYGCNVGRQGNYEVFIPKLIREMGQRQYEYHVAQSRKPFKMTRADYEDLINYYSMRLASGEAQHSEETDQARGE